MSQKKITRAEELAALLFNDSSSDSEAAVDKDDSSYLEVAADRDDPSDPEDFTQEGLKAKEVALGISKSIVSLVSSVDGKLLFACTGTVVDHVGSSTWILTSATLVRKPGSDYDAYQGGDVKIEVLLHNKRTIEGCIAMCSLLYNIAVVTIESQLDLPTVNLCDLPGCYFMLIRPVIVVGRDSKSKSLLVRHGEMIRESSKLDCNELLVCTCPVSKILIGGIVMDFERRIIGITFFDKDTIPFLPIEIVTRCLVHFKDFGTLKQPCICIRGQALHRLELRNLEKICYRYPELSSGVLVEKIGGIIVVDDLVQLMITEVRKEEMNQYPPHCVQAFGLSIGMATGISETLPENCGGIEVDDIICSVDEVVLYSVAQLTAIFLDKMVVATCTQNTVILQAVILRPRDNTKFVAKLNIREIPSGEHNSCFNNRWTLP